MAERMAERMAELDVAMAAFIKDLDRLQIIIESINREGGFERLTASWPRKDAMAFCQELISLGEMFGQGGRELLKRIGGEEGI